METQRIELKQKRRNRRRINNGVFFFIELYILDRNVSSWWFREYTTTRHRACQSRRKHEFCTKFEFTVKRARANVASSTSEQITVENKMSSTFFHVPPARDKGIEIEVGVCKNSWTQSRRNSSRDFSFRVNDPGRFARVRGARGTFWKKPLHIAAGSCLSRTTRCKHS